MLRLWGDCHTHSTWSDGLMGVAEQTPFFEAFGDDFRFQSDHLIVGVPAGAAAGKWLHAADWARYAAQCREATTAAHLCVAGVEFGWETDAARRRAEGWFDTKYYPRGGGAPPDESFFAGRTWIGSLRALREAGRVVVAHVDQGAPLGLLAGDEIDGLEIRWDIEETRPVFGRPSLAAWDRMLAAGHRVGLSSGSDGHQPDQWAGSALRTVVRVETRDPGAIADAVAAGRSYLAGTWHPDCYGALGCPEHPNVVAGGPTRFTPWWDFKDVPALAGRSPAGVVRAALPAVLDVGRCRRADYPELLEFTVDGAESGDRATAARRVRVTAGWRTHVPVKEARLIADGAVVHAAVGDALDVVLDLRGRRSLRLEVEAEDPADPARREALLANPVYLAG